ncbi:MAG TPA: lipoate--protein ligase, partial [Lactobacillus sp.]|nr:lipoate--protein ligase [Lactobacillus sp.]
LAKVADKAYHLTDEDKKQIQKLYDDYYNNWDWVYGTSPEFTVKRRQHFDAGTIDARVLVEKGRIKQVTFFGDFFGEKYAVDLAKMLKDVRYDQPSLRKALAHVNVGDYFAGITLDEFVQFLG